MSNKWYVYNTTTGVIHRKLMCAVEMRPDAPEGYAYTDIPFEQENARKYYVDMSGEEPVVTARPALSLTYDSTADADGTDEIVITGIPVGTFVHATLPDGIVSATVDDGTVELSCTVAGTAQIRFVPLTHIEETIEVTFI